MKLADFPQVRLDGVYSRDGHGVPAQLGSYSAVGGAAGSSLTVKTH